MDSGIWRRLIVIPFTAKIEGKSDIKNYSKYLVRNAAPYILKWTIEGAEKAIERGCSIPAPACVRDAVKRYREESDWLTHFLEECCETGEDLSVPSGELYESYRAFCLRTGDFARSTSEFYSVMEQRGFERMRRKTGRYVLGLRLVDMTAFQA
jgi:phage/plasmid-associated DNA primase